MEQRKKFNQEFKVMTVELSKNREDLLELARELDIRVELIFRWPREFSERKTGSFLGHGKPKHTSEEAEIARLKKELRDAQMERDGAAPRILKKAVSIFSRNDGRYSNS